MHVLDYFGAMYRKFKNQYAKSIRSNTIYYSNFSQKLSISILKENKVNFTYAVI